jgi:hypothetical protein
MRRMLKWESLTALTALASVVVALVFSALQMQQMRRATELQLFTQLHQLVNASQSQVDFANPELARVFEGKDETLSPGLTKAVVEAVNNMDYLAWLFNQGFIGLPEARQLWLGPVQCFRWLAEEIYGPEYVETSLTNLVAYAKPKRC